MLKVNRFTSLFATLHRTLTTKSDRNVVGDLMFCVTHGRPGLALSSRRQTTAQSEIITSTLQHSVGILFNKTNSNVAKFSVLCVSLCSLALGIIHEEKLKRSRRLSALRHSRRLFMPRCSQRQSATKPEANRWRGAQHVRFRSATPTTSIRVRMWDEV